MSCKQPILTSNKNNNVIKRDVDLSTLGISESDPFVAFVLENTLTQQECQRLISLAEQTGFGTVPVNYGEVEIINQSVRTGERAIVDSEELVSEIWNRISEHIPKKVRGAQVVGLNERLRFLKYSNGGFFRPHMDGNYVRPYNNLEMSLLTIQMYLNEEFDGGETTFVSHFDFGGGAVATRVPIKPKTGMVLVFSQDLPHEGSVVKNGIKHTVRTDIMYRYGSTST